MDVACGKEFRLVGIDSLPLSFRVGNGKRVRLLRFWHDVWYGDHSLKELCP